jgi:hypothetical protein
VLDDVAEICKFFKITQETFFRMAVYHGIERMDNGYIPKRNYKRDVTSKIEIELPDETWLEFDTVRKYCESNNETQIEHVPDGKLIELFIIAELRKFKNVYDDFETYNTKHDSSKIKLEISIPSVVLSEVEDIKNNTEISDEQFVKYLFINGLISEYTIEDFSVMESDLDLLEEIEKLGLNRLKTFTLLRYLLANSRIIWKNDNYRKN